MQTTPENPVTEATMAEAGFPTVAPTSAEVPGTEEETTELPVSFNLALYAEHMQALPQEDFSDALDVMLVEAHHRGLITDPTSEPEQEAAAAPASAPEQAEAQTEPAPDEHVATRELLKRYKLPQAWQDAQGTYHFEEKAALKAAGGNADSLTVILPE